MENEWDYSGMMIDDDGLLPPSILTWLGSPPYMEVSSWENQRSQWGTTWEPASFNLPSGKLTEILKIVILVDFRMRHGDFP